MFDFTLWYMLLFLTLRYTCRKDGNPFNSTVAPSRPPTSSATPPPAPPFFGPRPVSGSSPVSRTPPSQHSPGKQADGPTALEDSNSGKKKSSTTKKIVWISIAGVLLFVILALVFLLFMPRCIKRRGEVDRIFKRHQVGAFRGNNREEARDNGTLALPTNQMEKGK